MTKNIFVCVQGQPIWFVCKDSQYVFFTYVYLFLGFIFNILVFDQFPKTFHAELQPHLALRQARIQQTTFRKLAWPFHYSVQHKRRGRPTNGDIAGCGATAHAHRPVMWCCPPHHVLLGRYPLHGAAAQLRPFCNITPDSSNSSGNSSNVCRAAGCT
jgi:hypothetical protein